ncbi:hypothetical protein DFH09DRAFT_1083889 [Mycena vulgaris]|nr:hypothetical protein DFH09DRAFT_1083889 [Mycena vulgaris]
MSMQGDAYPNTAVGCCQHHNNTEFAQAPRSVISSGYDDMEERYEDRDGVWGFHVCLPSGGEPPQRETRNAAPKEYRAVSNALASYAEKGKAMHIAHREDEMRSSTRRGGFPGEEDMRWRTELRGGAVTGKRARALQGTAGVRGAAADGRVGRTRGDGRRWVKGDHEYSFGDMKITITHLNTGTLRGLVEWKREESVRRASGGSKSERR